MIGSTCRWSAVLAFALVLAVQVDAKPKKDCVPEIVLIDGVYGDDAPPEHTKIAQAARFMVHKAEYVFMGTISTLPRVTSYPFVNVLSTADGPRGNGRGRSTGTPYFYTTMRDFSTQDLVKDNRTTLMISMAQTGWCQAQGYDADHPKCPRVMLTGSLETVPAGTDEQAYGYQSMIQRHPAMAKWPPSHQFYIAKLNIFNIEVLNWFGGVKNVPVDEYYRTDPETGLPTDGDADNFDMSVFDLK